MITKELVHSLFEIKDGLFYHKERPIRNGRDKIFNEKYSGKLAGHNGNCYKVTIKNKQYKVSDILDFLETGEFIVKTRNIPRFEALRFVQRNNKTVVVGYQQWLGIISRLGGNTTYSHVSVSDEFLDFDNYLSWATKQKGFNTYDEDGFLYHIDKDLLSPVGNPIYSGETCVFIPKILNLLCKPSRNSKLLKGVQFQSNKKKPYRAYINIDGKPKHLGYHSSEVEANSEYVRARLSYIDDLYTKYKDTVDSRVWECVRDSRWW